MRDCIKSRAVDGCQALQRVWAGFVAWPMALTVIQSTNVPDFFIREFGSHVSLPSFLKRFWHQWAPRFLDCVPIVVGLRSKKKVLWSHTWWIVAAMQNVHAIWNRAVVQFPRKAVSGNTQLIWWTAKAEPSVPAGMLCSGPQPARVGLLNVRPEAFLKPFFHRSIHGRQCTQLAVVCGCGNFKFASRGGL